MNEDKFKRLIISRNRLEKLLYMYSMSDEDISNLLKYLDREYKLQKDEVSSPDLTDKGYFKFVENWRRRKS